MSKPLKSKLDPFAQTLAGMELEKKTLAEMVAWLKQEGVTVSSSTLSDYLSGLRSARTRAAMLSQITTGARQCKEVKAAFEKNPAPEMETLIKLVQVMIMQLSTEGVENPATLKLANDLTITVIQFLSGQTRAGHKEREVALAESKAAEEKKSNQEKALEFCLAESKGTPAEDLFKQAFAALKKAKASQK